MSDQPGGLVHHDPVGAFGHDAEFHGFGREGASVGRGLGPDGQDVARTDRLPDFAGRAVDQHVAGLDPPLQSVAGMVGQQACQHLVQPVGARGGRHGYKLRLPPRGIGVFVGVFVG
ncbi:hypothetical protein D3C85_1476710 [compost metagenome]